MPLIRKTYTRFNGGLVSREIASRSDRDFFHNSAEELTNLVPLLSGPAIRRGGTQYMAALPHDENVIYTDGSTWACRSSNPHLVEFKFAVGECYLLIFLTNVHENCVPANRTEIHIYRMDGTFEAAICQMDDASPIPTPALDESGAANFSWIRYRQKGDVIYFVDSTNPQYKMERSGSAGAYTWTVKSLSLTDDPGSAESLVKYTLSTLSSWSDYSRTCTNQGYPANGGELENAFSAAYGSVSTGTHNSYVISPVGNDFLCSWGSDGRMEFPGGRPTYFHSYPISYALRLTGDLVIATAQAGRYSFGMNLCGNGDFSIDRQSDEDVIFGIYGGGLNLAGQPRAADSQEFILGGSPASKVLSVGTHPFMLRLLRSPNPINKQNTYEANLVWRKENDEAEDGVKREGDDATSKAQFQVTRQWKGYRIYEIQILTYDLDGVISFKWRWRHVTGVADETFQRDWNAAWEDCPVGQQDIPISTPPMNSGNPYTLTFEDNVHLRGGTITAGKVYFTDPASVVAGDTYTFRVGYLGIPMSMFQYQDPTIQETGYPLTLEFHGGRLVLGGFTTVPYRLNASEVFRYEVFTVLNKGMDNEAFVSNIIEGGQLNQINWISSLGKLIVGTVGGIHILPHNEELLTPANSKSRAIERIGTAFIEPALHGRTVFFVDNSRTQLYALTYDELQGYNMVNVSSKVENIFTSDKLKAICFQQGAKVTFGGERHQILWCLTDAGDVYGLSWEMPNDFLAWHHHEFGGIVRGLASLPNEGGDRLYLLIERTMGTITRFYVELLEPNCFADCSAVGDTKTGAQAAGTQMSLPAQLANLGITDSIHAWVYRTQDGIMAPYPITNEPVPCTAGHKWLLPEAFTFTTDEDIYVGYAIEPVLTLLPPEATLQDGATTQGWLRGWESITLRTSKSSGKLEIQRLLDRRSSPRIVPATLTFANRITESRYTILGYDFLGQIRIKQTSPACLEILLIEGSIEYDR